MKEDYYDRANRLATTNTEPTLTDQAGAEQTDLNIIMKKFMTTGTIPGTAQEPFYLDSTALPTDLRGFIHKARELEEIRGRLPEQLKNKTTEELLQLTPTDIQTILTPPKQLAEETTK